MVNNRPRLLARVWLVNAVLPKQLAWLIYTLAVLWQRSLTHQVLASVTWIYVFLFPEGLLSLGRYYRSVKGFKSENTLSIKAGGCISFIVLYHRKRTYYKNTDQILVDYTGPQLARVQLTLK